MADYVLEGEKWGGSTFGSPGGNVTWAVDSSVPSYFTTDLVAALADWAKYANITFSQVSSPASANIDFSLAYIDGSDQTLGETSFSYSGDTFRSAGITFDSGEGWHQSGAKVISADGIDLSVVALHEIGHAIGLDHYNVGPAIMNASLDRSLTDLTQSDIDGVQAIYGSHTTVSDAAYFGGVTYQPSSPGGEVYALYDALLDRTPDPLGLENFTHALQSGLSVHDLALALLQSGEGQAHVGAADNSSFVEQLYETALHRHGDSAGLSAWTNQLNHGVSRADVATDFAFSTENENGLAGAYQAGIFVADTSATDAARLYYGILDRAPDAGGLSAYRGAIQAGTSLHDLAQSFINSAEFQAKGALSDSAFVDDLYEGALGRHADSAGQQSWQAALQHGASRADVAVGIAESQEAHLHHVSAIETGWHLA